MARFHLFARKILTALPLIGLGAVLALPALAQVDTGLEFASATGLTTTDIRTIVSLIIRAFLGLLGITAVALIVYGGFVYMMSRGDSAEADRGKKIIVNAVIGLLIIALSYAIAAFILKALGEAGEGGSGGDDCPPGSVCTPELPRGHRLP